MRISVVGIAAALLLVAAAPRSVLAQEQDQPERIPVSTGDQSFDPNQPIKPGFQVAVTVQSAGGDERDLTGVFTVDATGAINMKLINRVELKGLTPAQASDKIAALLKPYLKDPKAQVNIVSVPKPVIFLSGGVSRPGPLTIDEGTTLAEVLTVLGFSDNADLSHVRVFSRDAEGKRVLREFDLTRWLKPLPGEKPDEGQNPVLAPRDQVYVPLKILPGTGNVTVEGDVIRPGIVPIRVGVSTHLREVISLSGGPTPTGDRRSVAVRRLGVERPIVVDYDRMEQGDPDHNIVVQADDIVYVRKLDVDKFINLNGAFVRPGRLPYQRAVTLTQAIGDAGGLDNNAKEHEGRVYRHLSGADPTRTQVIWFNYKKIRNNEEPDILLMPGDTVEIPTRIVRPPIDPIQLTTQLLSIALLVDRLVDGRRR